MNLDAAIAAQIEGKLVRASMVVRIATDPPVRAWFGNGDLEHEADAVETEGGLYKGVGLLPEMPPLQQMVNGAASRVDLTASGVDARIVALADADASEVRSKRVDFGIKFFDTDWAPLGQTIWLAQYEADVIRTDMVSTADFNRARSVTLSIGSIMTGRRRPKLAFWTRAWQRLREATDAFCDRVSLYTAEAEIKWPP